MRSRHMFGKLRGAFCPATLRIARFPIRPAVLRRPHAASEVVLRRTKEQAAETKAGILDAAETLFTERGYDEVSLEEIAVMAGVTRGAVHWHFSNKQGLLVAIRNKRQLPLQELADGLLECPGASPLALLADTVCAMLEELHTDKRRRKLIRMMLQLDAILPDDCPVAHQIRNDASDAMRRIFEAQERKKPLQEPWTPETAAQALEIVVIGILQDWSFERTGMELVPHGQTLVRQVLASF